MASSNTLKDQLLDLFPDNNNQEISAADVRNFVTGTFDYKEELVIKINSANDIIPKRDIIFEKSIVIIESTADKGLYLSNVNNPINISQLLKIADISGGNGGGNLYSDGSVPMDINYTPVNSLDIATVQYVIDSIQNISTGNPFPPNTTENFLFTYDNIKVVNEAEYFFINDNIDNININYNTEIFYNVSFIYGTDGNITERKIQKINDNYCTTLYTYTNDIISKKEHFITIV